MDRRAPPEQPGTLNIRCDGCTHFLAEIEGNENKITLRLPCRSCNLDNHVQLDGMTLVKHWTAPKAGRVKATVQPRAWTQ